MLLKFKNYCNEKMIKLASFVVTKADRLSSKKGDTQLIVLIMLLAIVMVAVALFKDTFMPLLKNAMNMLTGTFNNLFT